MIFRCVLLLSAVLLLLATATADEMVSGDHQSFADSLTSVLYEKPNECTSSLGLSMAFSLVYPSSTGATTVQIRDVLGYPESQQQLVWNETSTSLVAANQGECLSAASDGTCRRQAPLLEIAYSVWYDEDDTLNPSYQQVVGDLLYSIDFGSDDAGQQINEWVDESTNGLIDSIVSDGPQNPDTVLMALSSIYLKASWSTPFMKSLTNEDAFYTSPSRTAETDSKAHFMHAVDYFSYSDTALPGYQILRLGFVGDKISMIFVLPNHNSEDTDLVASSVAVIDSLPQLERTRVAVALPKFKIESTYEEDLVAALKTLGITAPFEDGGLCVLANGNCSSYIDKVIQKTFIDVNEDGVEAAAVTLISIIRSAQPDRDPSEPVLFMADHPFQFFVYESSHELMLFEGRIGGPGIPKEEGVEEDEPAAPLDAVHSDADFWSANFDGAEPVQVARVSVPSRGGTADDGENAATSTSENGDDNAEVPSSSDSSSAADSWRVVGTLARTELVLGCCTALAGALLTLV